MTNGKPKVVDNDYEFIIDITEHLTDIEHYAALSGVNFPTSTPLTDNCSINHSSINFSKAWGRGGAETLKIAAVHWDGNKRAFVYTEDLRVYPSDGIRIISGILALDKNDQKRWVEKLDCPPPTDLKVNSD